MGVTNRDIIVNNLENSSSNVYKYLWSYKTVVSRTLLAVKELPSNNIPESVIF